MALPLSRPAPHRSRARAAHPRESGRRDSPGDGTAWLPRHRDAEPDAIDPGGRARLPGAGAAATWSLVRLAAVAAAVQAAAHGRRPGALLPDCALLPRRGLSCRPHA